MTTRLWIKLGLGCAAALSLAAAPAQALKVVSWNLYQYNAGVTARQPHFRTVIASINPDVIMVQELQSQAGRDSFLLNVLNVVQPGQWVASTYQPAAQGAFFWKPSRVDMPIVNTFNSQGPRHVLVGVAKPVNFNSTAAWFRLYSMHLKAGSSQSDENTRTLECTNIRNVLNSVVQTTFGTNFLLGGDANMQGSFEPGYARLTEAQADNDGRSKDFLTLPSVWNNNSSMAVHHTQSPCASGCVGSSGGMDDRFDYILTSYSVQDGAGLDVVSYQAYGNDGLHFNQSINAGGNSAVPIEVANALFAASDHLPVVMTLQLPPKLFTLSRRNFGTVITGAEAQLVMAVVNSSPAPAEGLQYTLSAPAGFTAPAGSFVANSGLPNQHILEMSTDTAGAQNGTLLVNSNDPDTASKAVLLSGVVLSHAVPSLDSLSVTQAGTFDLGDLPVGQFPDSAVRVHNQGYNGLQARLSVESGVITGGGRFSIVGGFTPTLVGEKAADYTIRFDDAGATLDSTYEATLTLGSADEPLPGSLPASDLVVTLRARPISTPTATPGEGLPTALRFYPPRPNPSSGTTWFAFDLAARGAVALEIYDLSGRRVSRVAARTFDAGRHLARWPGTDDRGARVSAGLYLARLTGAGWSRTQRIVVLP